MYRALITIVDNEKPSLEKDLPDLAQKIQVAFAEIPANRRNQKELQAIKDLIRRIPLVSRSTWASFLRHGDKVVDYERLPKGILSPTGWTQWEKQRRKEKLEEIGRKRAAKELSVAKRGNRVTRGLQAKYDEYKMTSAHTSGPATRRMTLKLNDLQGKTARAVEHRLIAAGRNAHDSVGNLQLPSTDRWNELWESLTDCSMPTLEPGISRLQAMRQTVPITLEVFGRAVVGAAVARWALMESLLPEVNEVTAYELQALRELNLRGESALVRCV